MVDELLVGDEERGWDQCVVPIEYNYGLMCLWLLLRTKQDLFILQFRHEILSPWLVRLATVILVIRPAIEPAHSPLHARCIDVVIT